MNTENVESRLSLVMRGMLLGAILGAVAMLLWYLVSMEFMAILAGSGFVGLICMMPLVVLIMGGLPGSVIGGVIGYIASFLK